MGKPKKSDKRKKSENSPDNIGEGSKQRKMAASKQGQQTPQASQISYTGMSQPGLCYTPQAYTMNGIMNNGIPGMVNGITVSPPMFSPQSQP